MASALDNGSFSFESGHQDLIHDCQMDFYGNTLATASSDRSIRLYRIKNDNSFDYLTDLKGHKGPVWKVAWAHPKYGQVLASAGYDRQVIIWRCNLKTGVWQPWYMDNNFKSSVNTIQFAPTNNLELIAGSADGSIVFYTIQNNQWVRSQPIENAHNGGVNSISYSIATDNINIDEKSNNHNNNNNNNNPGGQNNLNQNINNLELKRFVSGGCDNLVKIWRFDYSQKTYVCTDELPKKHANWVRDVAWAPIPGSNSHSIIASCSEDKTVIIWKERNKQWKDQIILNDFNHKVWSVSWSELGNILAVASGENTVQLFKEGTDGLWHDISKLH